MQTTTETVSRKDNPGFKHEMTERIHNTPRSQRTRRLRETKGDGYLSLIHSFVFVSFVIFPYCDVLSAAQARHAPAGLAAQASMASAVLVFAGFVSG